MASTAANKFHELDLYAILCVEASATEEDIRKSYRKLALKCHPDKNPGDKEAAEKKFIELGKVFEILVDKSARAAYDAVRKQKAEKAKRDEQLDDKRRKLKEKLEAGERAARAKQEAQLAQMRQSQGEDLLQKEIERLRREGSRLLEEEMNIINEQLQREKTAVKRPSTNAKPAAEKPPRIKVTWTGKLDAEAHADADTTSYDEHYMRHLLSKYGEIELLVISSSKKQNAIVEFKKLNAAVNCLEDADRLKETFGISLKWLGPDLSAQKSAEEPAQVVEPVVPVVPDPPVNASENELVGLSLEELEMAVLKKMKKS